MAKSIIVIILVLLGVGSELLKAWKKSAVRRSQPGPARARAAAVPAMPAACTDTPPARRQMSGGIDASGGRYAKGMPAQEAEKPVMQQALPCSETVNDTQHVTREELRKAVIWSEILKPKF